LPTDTATTSATTTVANMPLAAQLLIYTIVFLFGITVGSFLNVLIYRLPRHEPFVAERSHCPHCQHQLGALDLIPILSYLALGRRCRYCRAPISPRYMLVELTGGMLAVCAWYAYLRPAPLLAANTSLVGSYAAPFAACLTFAVLCILLVVALIDAQTMQIPNGLSIALFVCGLLSMVVGPEIGLTSRVIGMLCVSLPLFVLALVIPSSFGGGDIKLMAAAGFLLGWQLVLVAFFIGVILGGAWGIYLLLTRKSGAKGHFAFGPALCLGIGAALFCGDKLLAWYLPLLGL